MRPHRLALSVSLVVLGLTVSTAVARAQSGVVSVCVDGTTSTAAGRGACSGHGGVDAKATAGAKKAGKNAVMCADGTMSKGGQGACSGHGGIKSPASVPATKSTTPSLPSAVPASSPARTRSEAKSRAPTAPNAATKPATKRGADKDPTDAIAQCKDGTYWHAATRSGACLKHGGVAKFLKS